MLSHGEKGIPVTPEALFESLMQEKCTCSKQLTGGVTNSSYFMQVPSGDYVLRIPGEGTNSFINRSHEIDNVKLMEGLFSFVPEVCYANASIGVLISKYVKDSMPMSVSDMYDPERLLLMCNCLLQVHNSGARFSNEFDIIQMRHVYARKLACQGVEAPEELKAHREQLESATSLLFDEYPKKCVTCHGDPKLNNFLFAGSTMYLIDWEYSGMADPYFDLVNMVMTDRLIIEQEEMLLDAYEELSGEPLDRRKYKLFKIATDYMWIYWHLIKIAQGSMIEYNETAWTNRLTRALGNLEQLEELR